MANKHSLLPPNASMLERAFERATDKLSAPDAHTLWNAHDCPERLLPWLAWSMGVENWDDEWPASIKRSTIAAAMKIARHRGSVWAVKEALIAAGYAGAEIEEGLPPVRHNGAQLRNGLETYGAGNRWAMFRLIADIGEERGVSGEELARLLGLIDNAKPARSQLTEIEYQASIADAAAPEEQSAVQVAPQFSDVRPAGHRRDGNLSRHNAEKQPPPVLLRASEWQRNGEVRRTGLSPYFEWHITGATRENPWDTMRFDIAAEITDTIAVAPLKRRGSGRRDGTPTRGASMPPAIDAATLTISRRQRRNAHLARNAAARRVANQHQTITM